jgi:hypothetical protein
VSFDVGHHDVVGHAKDFIDQRYPGRHELVLGDSKLTLPLYRERHPEVRFDLIFIDGGHDLETVRSDIANFGSMGRPGTAVVVDDLMPWYRFGTGPTRAWDEAVAQGRLIPVDLFQDGRRVPVIEPPGERAWGHGRYC